MKLIKVFIGIVLLVSSVSCSGVDVPVVEEEEKAVVIDYYLQDKKDRVHSYIRSLDTLLSDNKKDAMKMVKEGVEFSSVFKSEYQDYLGILFESGTTNKDWVIYGFTHFEDSYKVPASLNEDLLLFLINGISDEKTTKEAFNHFFAAEADNYPCGCGISGDDPDNQLVYIKSDYHEIGNSRELELYDGEDGLSGYFTFSGDFDEGMTVDRFLLLMEEAIARWDLQGVKSYFGTFSSNTSNNQNIRLEMYCSDLQDNVETRKDFYSLRISNQLDSLDEKYSKFDVDLIENMIQVFAADSISKEAIIDFLLDDSGAYQGQYVVDYIEKNYNQSYDFKSGWNLEYNLTAEGFEQLVISGLLKKE